MDISRSAVLSGHVVATMLRSLVAITAIIEVAFALGFRPAASFLEWLGAIGLIVLVSFAASWLTVALGLFAKTPDSAGVAPVTLILLPFLGRGSGAGGNVGAGARRLRGE